LRSGQAPGRYRHPAGAGVRHSVGVTHRHYALRAHRLPSVPKIVRADAARCSDLLGSLPGCPPARAAGHHPALARSTFDLIVVDLPLRWVAYSPKGEGRSPQRHYPTTDVPALIRMRPMFDAVMAKNCAGCFWVYGPRLPDTLKVIQGWAFTSNPSC
jgi:hypothetical protein